MAEGINVRLSGKLREFVHQQAGEQGMYESVSEYVRSLIRNDYEQKEARKREWLCEELSNGMNASEEEFVPFDPEEILATAKESRV